MNISCDREDCKPVKNGKTSTGFQRYRCRKCERGWSDSPLNVGRQPGKRSQKKRYQFTLLPSLGEALKATVADSEKTKRLEILLEELN